MRDCFEGFKPISWKSSFASGRIILSRVTKLTNFGIMVLGVDGCCRELVGTNDVKGSDEELQFWKIVLQGISVLRSEQCLHRRE